MVQDLKDDVKEIKSDMKDVVATVNSLRVLIAENYVTRKEYEDYKKEEKSNRWRWASFIIAATGMLMAAINIYLRS